MIKGIISPENELIDFTKGFMAKGEVEKWLNSVQDNMRESIKKYFKKGRLDFDLRDRKEWVLLHPA